MNDIGCMFRFNPVGQGLFYSGQIDSFTFVYDCGGKKACVLREIAKLPKKPLDLLIISHMHSDHTRYVNDLINHCGGINRVVLPYLHPEEILLAIGEYLSSSDSNGPSDGFIRLVQDPQGVFGEKTEVSFINGKPLTSEDSLEQPNEGDEFAWTGTAYDGCRSHKQSLRNILWLFKFYNEPISDRLRNQFVGQLRANGIDPYADKIDVPDNEKSLKEAYQTIAPGNDLNRTSLLCLHRPLKRVRSYPLHHSMFWLHPRLARNLGGTLLTGDIHFKHCIESFIQHFHEDDLNSVCWASVPHHGSCYNWHNGLFGILPNCYYWICTCRSLISAHHPHKNVLQSFFRNYPILYPCTEDRAFDYRMIVHRR